MNRHLSPHSQIKIICMLKLHLDIPYFYRMECRNMQEHIIKTTQIIRYLFFLIRRKDFVQIILKIRYHQVMLLQPTITNTNHETNCISYGFLHISTTTFPPKWHTSQSDLLSQRELLPRVSVCQMFTDGTYLCTILFC